MDGSAKEDGSPANSGLSRDVLQALCLTALTILLIQACASGDVAKVADLVSEKNVDPFASDGSGRTPLAVACEAGHMEVVKFLMERDKEGRALKGAGGTTPLHVAARGGHVEVVKYLIDDRGMDPSCEDSDGFTPLDCAQNNKMRKFLLSRGARASKATSELPSSPKVNGGTPDTGSTPDSDMFRNDSAATDTSAGLHSAVGKLPLERRCQRQPSHCKNCQNVHTHWLLDRFASTFIWVFLEKNKQTV